MVRLNGLLDRLEESIRGAAYMLSRQRFGALGVAARDGLKDRPVLVARAGHPPGRS
jgi:hypothetical protein